MSAACAVRMGTCVSVCVSHQIIQTQNLLILLNFLAVVVYGTGAYEVIKRNLIPEDGRAPPLQLGTSALVALSSASSVVVSALFRAPLDMIKTQMQAGTEASVVSAARTAWSTRGIAGFYKGAGTVFVEFSVFSITGDTLATNFVELISHGMVMVLFVLILRIGTITRCSVLQRQFGTVRKTTVVCAGQWS